MNGWLKICNAVHWLALTLWIASLVSAGVAATGVFSKLPTMKMTIDQYRAYDSAEHGRLAAGMIMEPVFTFVDIVQLTCGGIVILTLLAQLTIFKMSWKNPSNMIRMACLFVAVCLFAMRALTITPTMNHELRAYWSAAEAGQIEAAREHRQMFDSYHPKASKMFNGTLALLLVGVVATSAALGPAGIRRSPLQKPRLMDAR